jgi:hypothetical protein
MADFLRSDTAIAKNPLKLGLAALGVTSVIPAIFTVIVLLQGQRFNPGWLSVWILFWVVGGAFAYVMLQDAARERRDLAGGVFTRWIGPFAVRQFRTVVQVVVDGRKLQTLAAPLELTESGSGTVDYLPTSGMLLELRDESGQLLWSRFPGS